MLPRNGIAIVRRDGDTKGGRKREKKEQGVKRPVATLRLAVPRDPGRARRARGRRRARRNAGVAGGSHEELLQEVLGKQVLQVVVDALALVGRARLAHAENRQAEVLHFDARLRGAAGVVAAL